MEPRRFILYALVVGVILYLLYPHAPSTPDGSAREEITIWFGEVTQGRHDDVVDAFERRFNDYLKTQDAQSAGWRITLGSSAVRANLEGEGNPQRLMCGIAGGVPPEVVEYDRFAICQWAARGAFLDLTPLIERDRQELAAAQKELSRLEASLSGNNEDIAKLTARIAHLEQFNLEADDFFDMPWRECQYKPPGSDMAAGQYGIPHTMDNRVLYYNPDMLLQAGVVDDEGRPKPPDTWEEILRKRVDTNDAAIVQLDGLYEISSAQANFLAAPPLGVRPGDSVAHISTRGNVTRAVVDSVVDDNTILVRSPYARRQLVLPEQVSQHIKIFSGESVALRLSRWDEDGRLLCVGFEPQHGNAWLYLYGWCNGGRFMIEEDGRPRCNLASPEIIEALQWTTDVFDALGGADRVVAFRKSFQVEAEHPFLKRQIGMFHNGDWFIRDILRFKPDMPFGTCAPPIPAARFEAGATKMSWVAGFAYCIPATCPPDKLDAAWEFVKFLSSVEGGMILNEHDAQRERAQGRRYVSRLKSNRALNAFQIGKYIDVPSMPPRIKAAMQTHLDMVERCHFRPVSPAGQVLWNAQADAQDLAWSHSMSPAEALQNQAARVDRALANFYDAPRNPTKVNWMALVAGYLALLLLTASFLFIRYRKRPRSEQAETPEVRAGLTFIAPWLLGFIVLSGGPMAFSAIMSFSEYDVINDATYVGLDNYREMFTVDWGGPDRDGKETVPAGVRRALVNTLFMALGLPFFMGIGLALALLLNAGVRGLRVYRTLFFIPAIMPVVAASILWLWVFNAQNGLLNYILNLLYLNHAIEWMNVSFEWFNLSQPVGWLTNKFTSKPALIIMSLWTAGSSMIIWLAGLKDIPHHLYEAAAIDGASAIRRFIRITLPLLSPYILFNLIIGLINTFQIFTQAYIMTPNGYPERSTYFYVYKLFDECFTYFRLGYGAAMAWVLFVILIVLTLLNMRLSKKWVFYAGE